MAQITTGKQCNTVMLLNETYFNRSQEEGRRKKESPSHEEGGIRVKVNILLLTNDWAQALRPY
jgi:hypothetical protein